MQHNKIKKPLWLTDGHVIDPETGTDHVVNLVVDENGTYEEIHSGPPKDATHIECKGHVIAPGFVDIHTHLRDPGHNGTDIVEGSIAAVAGGFTTLCCMANTRPVNDHPSITELIVRRAQDLSPIRILPIGAVTHGLQGKQLTSFAQLIQAGCIAFSDDGIPIKDGHIMRLALREGRQLQKVIIAHCEDPFLRRDGSMNEGELSSQLGFTGNPDIAEAAMIERDLLIAEDTNASLHIAHLSTKKGLEAVARAKKKKIKVTCEATPHHFSLNQYAIQEYGTHAKVAPPLRTEHDRHAIIEGLIDGTIDAIATDHAPHPTESKEQYFCCASPGICGLETAFLLGLKLVHENGMPLPRLIHLMTRGPSQILGLPYGSIFGSNNDLCILNTKKISSIDFKNKPFGSIKTRGYIKMTIAKATIAFENKNI